MVSQVEGTGWPSPKPDERDYQGAMDRPEDAHWYREGRRAMFTEVLEMFEGEYNRSHLGAAHRLDRIRYHLQKTKEAMGGSDE